MMGDWSGWGWGMGLGWIFMVLFWALVILGIFALGKWLFSGSGPGGSTHIGTSGKSAFDILKERYARGEINRDQYEQMRRDIEA